MVESIIKTLYLHPKYNRDERTGRFEKLRDDALFYIVGKNDGTRDVKIIVKPKYKYYLAKEDMGYHRLSIPIEKATPVVCEYSNRHNSMAEVLGLKDQYKQAKMDWRTKREWVQRNLYNNPQLYQADMNIEDLFKLAFNEKHGDHSTDIEYKTSFTDIEVRADMDDFEQHKALVPICSICHLDTLSETIYVMVLNDDKVPMIKEVFNNLGNYVDELRGFLKDIRNECVEKIKKKNGDSNSVHSFDFNFQFFLFEKEEDLIVKYFEIIKNTKPDFCGIWNINFDMITIKNRAAKLGLNMADLVSDNIIPPKYRYFEYVEDHERFKNGSQAHYSRYFDKVITTSSTQWYCQMSLHSNLRKRFLEDNYKLNTIGEKYANMKKLNLEDLGYTIKDVYVKNFKVFLNYAIIDPIVQFMVERVNGDIPRYMVNCKDTQFFNGIRKTYGIKNELSVFLKNNKQEIIGNNKTYDISEFIPGAIIASPKNIVRKGEKLLGVDTHIYRNCVDLDITAEYPSLKIVYNILKTTLYGRIINIYVKRDLGDGMIINTPISDGATFNKMLQTIDTSILDIGQKYFGLCSMDELITHIEKSCLK